MNKSMHERRSEILESAKAKSEQYGDDMTRDQADEINGLLDEYDQLGAEIKAANERKSVLDRVRNAAHGDSGPEGAPEERAASLGAHFVKHAGDVLRMQANGAHTESITPEYETRAADDPMLSPSADGSPLANVAPWATEFRRGIVNAKRDKLVIADLLGSATVSPGTQTISYLVEKSPRIAEGGAGTVAEGARKPFVRFAEFQVESEKLKKIAALTRITDETAEDLNFIRSWIDNTLIYELSVVEEEQLLRGDGTGSNITGLLNREGVQQFDIDGDLFDGLLTASQKVPEATDFQADALVMHTADYLRLRTAKDGNGQYLAGGPFQNQYGNGGLIMNPAPWGLRVVDTPAIEQGSYLLGAFRQGATVLRKGGLRVDSTNTNADDFEHNLITLRAEERLGLMVERPAAFVTGKLAATGAASE
ncbi:phage major capsid protein [Corynebacterium imitans]|uniref:phage major capsid protein n=1 Tax=Corynebacterium imitans TaxID=156978 RepID=UPI00254D6200|nr:phage major capsid protein [Corynebacterium imitans]MDK8637528.1 phage major capsid protein [Corynebacterium imitans]MDK8772090.1 phage major capsid protein [Corynebacterium imitans]